MFKFFLANDEGKPLAFEKIHISGDEVDHVLETVHPAELHNSFKAVSETTEGIYEVVNAREGQAVALTDLMIFGKKSNAGEIIVRFIDDANNIIVIAKADTSLQPIRLSMPFRHAWRGWLNARLEVVNIGDVDMTVSMGYYIIKDALPFVEWDANRN